MQKELIEALEIGKKCFGQGKLASYIPELAKVNPNQLGISICDCNGVIYHIGDYDSRFTFQSIIKIIMLAWAYENCGPIEIFSRVGMEPSGEAFNAFIDLETSHMMPTNPLINAGSLVISYLISKKINFDEFVKYARELCLDEDIVMNEQTYQSEINNSSRNHAIAYLLKSKNLIEGDVEKIVDFYTRACSLMVTSDSLANLASILANDGINFKTNERLLSHKCALTVKTIMLTCGMYDGSGEFAVNVGMPSKSGVGGGVLAISDKRLGIGIFSPELDKKGNSVAGQAVLKYLSNKLDLHIFGRDN